jgi:MinD-like ATPase involved in chromosome partitioning or flagellar assembly
MTKFIAVVSGKGGVGKTTTAINLAKALFDKGCRVLVIDGNVVTPHLALQLGIINPVKTLNDFLKRKANLHSVIMEHHSGVQMIISSPSYNEGKKFPVRQLGKIFQHTDNIYDIVLVDCPNGLGYEVSTLLKYADEALIIAQPDIVSMVDALKIAALAREQKTAVTGLVLTMTNKGKHELSVKEVEEMTNLPVIGNIRYDKKIKKALHLRDISSVLYPRAKSSKGFRELAGFIVGEKKKK